MEALLKIERLYRFYGVCCAVHDLNFTLQRGEVLGFLGPNGAGKSTTMRMITGNLIPDSGTIHICGIDLSEQPLQAQISLGYLPEHPPLYSDMTVDEYLGYCARLHRIARPQILGAVARTKDRCGLSDTGKRLIANLSKGYQQRIGIAQAIIHDPPLLVLDEPTVGLDPNQIQAIRTLIGELGKDHGVILSTHLLPEVQSICHRVLILHQGRQVFADNLDSVSVTGSARTPALIIDLARPPQPEQIHTLAGVIQVDTLTKGRFRLHLDQTSDQRSQIAEQIVERGWGLLEMVGESSELEKVFAHLTTGEATE